MTTINLGIAVQSTQAVTAAADLDKLVVSSDKAEKGAKRVGGASKEMAAALGSITAILINIERNSSAMAAGFNQSATAALSLGKAATSASAALKQEATSVGSATAALIENTRAANENKAAMAARAAVSGRSPGASNFNTSNVAAQFQDIGVTAAMGMSPMMIALQQGTQLSAVLGGQGLTGVVRTLGGAFASVFSPVSLLTLGIVGLGAAGIQALMGMMNSTDDATSSLERHSEWLDTVLAGYDAARDAAQGAVDAALKLPQGVAEQNLRGGIDKGNIELAALTDKASASQENLNHLTQQWVDLRAQSQAMFPDDLSRIERFDALISQSDQLAQLSVNASSSASELEHAMTQSRALMSVASEPAIKNFLQDIYNLADGLRNTRGEIASTAAALASLNNQALQTNISAATDSAVAAIDRLRKLAPDLRTAYQKAGEELNSALAAPDQIIRDAALGQYAKTVAALDTQKAQQEALKAARTGASARAHSVDQWESATDNFQQRIEATQLEITTMGQSTEAINRQKAAFDLLNQAKQAGIPITASVTSQINAMAAQSAGATAQLERMTQAANDNNAIWAQAEDGVSSVIKTWAHGGDVLDAVSNKLGDIGDMLIDMAVRDLFGAAFGGGGGGGSGGFLSGALSWLGSLFGMPGHAMGTANTGGSVGQPAGIVHGQEAVIPLPSGGKVPVMVQGGGGAVVNHFHIDAKGAEIGVEEKIVKAIQGAAPSIIGASVSKANKSAPGALARYQQQEAGSDYRVA